MQFEPGHIFHVYNRGNDKQKIFFKDANYSYFLEKVKKYIVPSCSILNYCLMPNHFHLLIHADERSIKLVNHNALITRTALSDGFRLLLSAYAKGINVQESKVGNLFQQKTKAKKVTEDNCSEVVKALSYSKTYAENCFHYIHQNPLKAKLVSKMEDWQWSSFRDFAGLRKETICDKDFAYQLFGLNASNFYEESYRGIPDKMLSGFY